MTITYDNGESASQLPASLGQKTSAASLAVTIASDQSAIDITAIAGEDTLNNVLRTVNGADEYEPIGPGQIDVVAGATGAAADRFQKLHVNVFNQNNCSIFALDGTATNTLSTTAAGGSTVDTIVTANVTVSANALLGLTIKTNGQKRRCTGNTVAAAAPTSISLDHPLLTVPANGAAVTAEALGTSVELMSVGASLGAQTIPMDMPSVNGGWKFTTDTGVIIISVGAFS